MGNRQRPFECKIGLRLYEVSEHCRKRCKALVQEGIQGEAGYKTGLRIIFSLENRQTAYIARMGRKMVDTPERVCILTVGITSCLRGYLPGW